MTWVEKLKFARKRFIEARDLPDGKELTDEEGIDLFDALILLTEAIEEVGRANKTPLIDWDKPQS